MLLQLGKTFKTCINFPYWYGERQTCNSYLDGLFYVLPSHALRPSRSSYVIAIQTFLSSVPQHFGLYYVSKQRRTIVLSDNTKTVTMFPYGISSNFSPSRRPRALSSSFPFPGPAPKANRRTGPWRQAGKNLFTRKAISSLAKASLERHLRRPVTPRRHLKCRRKSRREWRLENNLKFKRPFIKAILIDLNPALMSKALPMESSKLQPCLSLTTPSLSENRRKL